MGLGKRGDGLILGLRSSGDGLVLRGGFVCSEGGVRFGVTDGESMR